MFMTDLSPHQFVPEPEIRIDLRHVTYSGLPRCIRTQPKTY